MYLKIWISGFSWKISSGKTGPTFLHGNNWWVMTARCKLASRRQSTGVPTTPREPSCLPASLFDIVYLPSRHLLTHHDRVRVRVKVTRSCPTLCDPMDYTVHGIPQARILARVALPFYRESSQSRDRTRSPTVQEGFLWVEPPGKPKNTGMGSLSLLQQILLTQELNRGLLRCRWILYQWSYQGSPVNSS